MANAAASPAPGFSPQIESPAQAAWRRLRRSRPALFGGVLLLLAYSCALFAGIFAPYRYNTRYSEHSYHRPDLFSMNWTAKDGGSLLHPTIGGGKIEYVGGKAEWRDHPGERYRLAWFVQGEEWSVLGLGSFRTHLFGLEPDSDAARLRWEEAGRAEGAAAAGVPGYPLFLFGADNFGRDIFSRLLYGGQISLTIGLIGIMISFSIGVTIGGISGFYGDGGMVLHGAAGTALRMKTMNSLAMFVCLLGGRVGLDLWAGLTGLTAILMVMNWSSRHRAHGLGQALRLLLWWSGSEAFVLVITVLAAKGRMPLFVLASLPGEIALLLLVSLVAAGIAWTMGTFNKAAMVVPMDSVLMRLVEVIMSMPGLYTILTLRGMFPMEMESWKTYLMIIVIMSFVYWASLGRLIRGLVLSIRELDYVQACRAMGASDGRILARHVLPATMSVVIVQATLAIPYYILTEVTLSFLGVGIQEPYASWGNMLNDAKNVASLEGAPWLLIPGICIFFTVMAWNFLGDGLRDALDPRQKV